MSAITIAINLIGNNLAGGAFSGLTSGITRTMYAARSLGASFDVLKGQTGQLAAVTAGAGVTFAAFFGVTKTGIEGAVELQDKLLTLQQAVQANSDAMPVLTQAVNDLGVKTVYSSSEAADAFAMLVRSGFDVSQVMYGAGAAADEYSQHAYDATEATHGLGFEALALGQALGLSATDGAILASTALHAFNGEIQASTDPTAKASEIVNDLAGAFLNGGKSGEDLLRFLQQAGPTAASLGVSFKDLMTVGDVLTQSMGDMGEAGTRLRYFMTTLIHPTTQQAKALSELGIQVVNNSQAYRDFEQKLISTGAATKDDIKLWDGSVTGLQKMFTAAQNVGLIPLDATFGTWAASNDLLNSSLYDAQGNFKGMGNAVDILYGALKNKTPEERTKALADLFNVRGGDAGRILANMSTFDQKYKQIWDRIGKTDAVDMAKQRLDTFKGASEALKDSLNSGLAVAFLNLLPPITNLVNKVNDLLQVFLNAPPQVQTALGVFLLVGTVLSGIALAVAGVATVIAILAPIFAAVGLSLGTLVAIFAAVPAIILIVAGFIALLVAKWNDLQAALAPLQPILDAFGSAIGSAFSVLQQVMMPFLNAAGEQFKSLGKTWEELKRNGEPLWQFLQMLAMGVGGVLVLAFGLLIGVIVGVIAGFTNLVTGIIEFVTGVIQIVVGFVALFNDLFGGMFQALLDMFMNKPQDAANEMTRTWEKLKQDVSSIFDGLGTALVGIITATFGTLIGLIGGFIGGAYNFFKDLYDKLVGHSIVPDMVNAIITWFRKLPGMVGQAILDLKDRVVGGFQDLANRSIQAVKDKLGQFKDVGKNLVQGLIDGVRSMGVWASKALSDLVWAALDAAKRILGIHSPSAVLHEVGRNTAQGFINGLLSSASGVQDAANRAFSFRTPSLNVDSLSVNHTQAAYAASQSGQGGEQTVNIYLDQHTKLASYVFDKATHRLKQAGVSRMRG